MRKEGFTLIELMIVIAIIAIIAAIAIPNLLTGRMTTNETAAIGSLKTIVVNESLWNQQDPDGNGVKDFWTFDVSCFHRMFRGDGVTKVAFVDISVGRSDFAPAARSQSTPTFRVGNIGPLIEDWTLATNTVTTAAKSGYLLRALTNNLAGIAYNQNLVPIEPTASGVAACNLAQFGFIAVPDVYAQTGTRMFIVDNGGTIYGVDQGGDVNRWMTTATLSLQWPSNNPPGTQGPTGTINYSVAD